MGAGRAGLDQKPGDRRLVAERGHRSRAPAWTSSATATGTPPTCGPGPTRLLSDAHFARFDFPAGFEQARRALDLAADIDDSEVTGEVELALGIQHLAALELAQAEEHLHNCERSAGRPPDPWASSWAASRLTLIRWCRGDLAGADAQATRAADLAADHFDWAESSLAIACRVSVAVAQGRIGRRGAPGHAGQPAVPAFRLPMDCAHPRPGAGRWPGLPW